MPKCAATKSRTALFARLSSAGSRVETARRPPGKSATESRFCPALTVTRTSFSIPVLYPKFRLPNSSILLYSPGIPWFGNLLIGVPGKHSPVPPAGGSADRSGDCQSIMTFIVYALVNRNAGKIYIGQTMDLEKRLKEHNEHTLKGYTSRFKGVWECFHTETFETRTEALQREKQLKSYRGRCFLKQLHSPVAQR